MSAGGVATAADDVTTSAADTTPLTLASETITYVPTQPVTVPPTQPTTDVLLITLNSDMITSRVDNVSLTPEDMVITNVDKDVTPPDLFDTLLASPDTTTTTTSTVTSSNDVFLVPPPRPALPKLSQLRSARYPNKSYTRPSHYIINPIVTQSKTTATHQDKPNDNSLLRALIQRPSMKITTSSLMRSIQIPIVTNAGQRTLIKSNSRTVGVSKAVVRAAARAARQNAASLTSITQRSTSVTVTTETTTTQSGTTAGSILSATLYGVSSTASVTPVTTVSYTTAKAYGYHSLEKRARYTTPILIPFATVTSSPTTLVQAATTNIKSKSHTTSTITSYTVSNITTPIKIIKTESLTTTATDIDTFTRVTYTTRSRNPVVSAVQVTTTASSVTTPLVATTVAQSTDKMFLEPLPVSEMRIIPAARTFSGPRKVTLPQRSPVPTGTQRVFIRHTNPASLTDKLVKNPAPLQKIADAAVTLVKSDVTKTVTTTSPAAETNTIPSSLSFTTTSGGTTHTLIVPHYKNTVFKNLSSLATGDISGRVSTEQSGSTERIVIRRPIAYFSPRRTFNCVTTTSATSTTTTPQRTIIRTIPISIAENRFFLTRGGGNVAQTTTAPSTTCTVTDVTTNK